MDVNLTNNVSNNITSTYKQSSGQSKANAKTDAPKSANPFSGEAAVYTPSGNDNKVRGLYSNETDRTAIIEKMKADSDAMVSQLKGIVEKMMTKQGIQIGQADDVWKFLASGEFTVDEAAKAKAKEAISENGYWGVEQTSSRIVDFAKALSGNDPSKADKLIAAFQKGFKEATKSWGKELPEISQKTYDAVLEKFDAWVNGSE